MSAANIANRGSRTKRRRGPERTFHPELRVAPQKIGSGGQLVPPHRANARRWGCPLPRGPYAPAVRDRSYCRCWHNQYPQCGALHREMLRCSFSKVWSRSKIVFTPVLRPAGLNQNGFASHIEVVPIQASEASVCRSGTLRSGSPSMRRVAPKPRRCTSTVAMPSDFAGTTSW